MSERELQALVTVAPQILESATFIFVDEVECNGRAAPADWNPLGVRLVYEGTSSGSLHLWAEPRFLRVLAANMLGLEEDDPQAASMAQDAFKELLNMTTGTFLTEVYGTAPVIHLAIPEMLDSAALEEDLRSVESVWIAAEGHQLLYCYQEADCG